MNDLQITILGRARVGKSLLLTRFVSDPKKIISLSGEGSDKTQFSTKLILNNKEEPYIKVIYKDGTEDIATLEDIDSYKNVSYIEILAKPSSWLYDIMCINNLTNFSIIDTKGVSGNYMPDSKDISWTSDAYILLMRNENLDEFAKSMDKIRDKLASGQVWHAVSLGDIPITSPEGSNEYNERVKIAESRASSVRSKFLEQLMLLEGDTDSLLSLKNSDLNRLSNVITVPNISIEFDDVKYGLNYVNKSLGKVIHSIINKDHSTDKIFNKLVSWKKEDVKSYLKYLRQNSLNIEASLENYKFSNDVVEKHLDYGYRLVSYDGRYIHNKFRELVSYFNSTIYSNIKDLPYSNFNLTRVEQSIIAHRYIYKSSNYLNNSPNLLYSCDGRESCDQATYISMLHAQDIINNGGQLYKLLGGDWNKNYLKDKDIKSIKNLPFYLATVGYYGSRFKNVVFRPFLWTAMYTVDILESFYTGDEIFNMITK